MGAAASSSPVSRTFEPGPVEVHRRPRPLLPAAPREPLARGGRDPGLGPPVARLERARDGRVLRAEHRRAARGRRQSHPRHRRQLREDLLQRRSDARRLARAPPPGRLREDPRGRPAEPVGPGRSRQRDRPGLQPRDHAARDPAGQGHAGPLGHRGLSASLRTGPRGHVAAGDGGRPRKPRGAGRGRHQVHHPRPAPGRARPPARRRDLAGGRRPRRPESRVPLALSDRACPGALLLRRPDLSRDRLRERPDPGRGAGRASARRLRRRPRVAAARPLRHRRRVLRPPHEVRRHGPRGRAGDD